MAFDLKKSVQEYTDLTIFRTPKSDISEREGNAVGILRDVLTQSPEVQQAFNQAVCQQTDRVFHGWDYWLGGQNVKAVRSAILYNSPADCSNSQQNRQLTVDLLNPQFSKISFAGQYVSSPELEEFKNLYVTGEFKLADDLSYVLDALPDFRTNGAKARAVLASLIPTKWLAYIGLFGGAFSFGFGTAKVSKAIQELNHIQDEKQRKVALRDLARGSSTMLLSLVSMLGASRNFDWSVGKNVTRLPTAASKAPDQPNRAVLPEDKIAPIRSKPSPTLLNQKPANDNSPPTAADENGYCVGNPSGPSGSPWFGSKGGQSFSNPPVQSFRSVAAAGGSGRASISSAASRKAEEMCEGAKYGFEGNAALKANPVQSTPIPPSTAPGQCGNGAALPANSPLIFSDYNGEHVSHASLINLKGVEEYLAHLIASFPTVLAVMMSGDAGSGNPINEKIEDKQAIDEVNPMVEIVEGFFTSYLESLEEELWAKLVSRTIEEEIAFQRESVPWRKIPPEIVAFAQRHPTARMWRLEVRPGGLEDESLNAEQIFFRNLLNYFHTQLNLSTDWSNWIGTSVYDLDNQIDSSSLLEMAIPGLRKKKSSPFRQMIIPPILFLLEVPTIFFADRAVRGVRTKKLSSESEMEAMADNNTRPLLTSNSSENLSDHANIFASSALKWFHDLSHIIELSRNLPETREDFRKIRYAVKAVLKQLSINLKPYSKLDVLLTSLFEGTDLQLIENPHLVFQLIAESLSVQESFIPNLPDDFIPTLYQQLQIFFPEGHPRREEVLDRFRRALAYTPPVPIGGYKPELVRAEIEKFVPFILNLLEESPVEEAIRDNIARLNFPAYEVILECMSYVEKLTKKDYKKTRIVIGIISFFISQLTLAERLKFVTFIEELIHRTDPKAYQYSIYLWRGIYNVMASIKDFDHTELLKAHWERIVSKLELVALKELYYKLIFPGGDPSKNPFWKDPHEVFFYLQLLKPVLNRLAQSKIGYYFMEEQIAIILDRLSSHPYTLSERGNLKLLLPELLNYMTDTDRVKIIFDVLVQSGLTDIDGMADTLRPILDGLFPRFKIIILKQLVTTFGIDPIPLDLIRVLIIGVSQSEFSSFLQSMTPTELVREDYIDDLYKLLENWEKYSHLQSGGN